MRCGAKFRSRKSVRVFVIVIDGASDPDGEDCLDFQMYKKVCAYRNTIFMIYNYTRDYTKKCCNTPITKNIKIQNI